MKNKILLRVFGTGLFLAVGAVTLAACQPEVPPPVPGQPLTWAQKYQLGLQEAQDMHDRRRQDHPCHPNNCF